MASVTLIITAVLGLVAAVMGVIADIDVNLLKSLDGLSTMGVLAFFAVQFFRANKELSREFSEKIQEITKRHDDRIEKLFAEQRAERQAIISQFNMELGKLIDNMFRGHGTSGKT